jgi:hypothetical protein
MSQDANVVGDDVEVVSSSLNLDANTDTDTDTDTALYGENDVLTPKLSDNETLEAAPDGQKQILIEAEIDSEASQDESTPMVVTQTQALPSADADEDAIILPNPPSRLTLRHYTPFYVKDYPTNIGAQYWLDEIPDPVFPVPRDTNFKPPYANWKGKFKNMLKYGKDFLKYQKFFDSGAPKTTDEDLIRAKIGTHTVTIKDLMTLAPGTWLNDTIIDRTTDLLAYMSAEYNALKKTKRKVAVFDSRFTALIIENPQNADPPCYNQLLEGGIVRFQATPRHESSEF